MRRPGESNESLAIAHAANPQRYFRTPYSQGILKIGVINSFIGVKCATEVGLEKINQQRCLGGEYQPLCYHNLTFRLEPIPTVLGGDTATLAAQNSFQYMSDYATSIAQNPTGKVADSLADVELSMLQLLMLSCALCV